MITPGKKRPPQPLSAALYDPMRRRALVRQAGLQPATPGLVNLYPGPMKRLSSQALLLVAAPLLLLVLPHALQDPEKQNVAPRDCITVIAVRHAEKDRTEPRDPALTEAGEERARELAWLKELFEDVAETRTPHYSMLGRISLALCDTSLPLRLTSRCPNNHESSQNKPGVPCSSTLRDSQIDLRPSWG